ncbi:fatty acid hydroxylase domain-containing protein 2-like isoform X2 [Diadema setosum]|uniref:fatty acid hydroxylase domain-containing protein 2-like isoform X2 n=1 Tax=Diadema setosum TaxID=31175 RepID=UPI003B3A3039
MTSMDTKLAVEEECCRLPTNKAALEERSTEKDGENEQEQRGGWVTHYCEVFTKLALIVGGFIIVVGAFRNTVTYYLQLFWGVSGDFWMRQWGKIYDFFEGDHLNISLAAESFLIIQYWIVCAFFLTVDIYKWPSVLLRYKIQSNQNDPIPPGKLRRAVLTVIANQTVVVLPLALAVYYYMGWRECGFSPAELPTFQWVMIELFVFLVIEEMGFYYSHRLFHHPRLYKYIHKKHHEWTAPISVVAIYAHPIEHIFANTLPAVMGPMVMGSHIATLCMWLTIAQTSAIISHCGYHFPLLPSPEAHDFHHLKFTNNYGTLGILDRFHGTDNLFRKTKSYQRHFLLLGLTPVAHTFPDDPKHKAVPCKEE